MVVLSPRTLLFATWFIVANLLWVVFIRGVLFSNGVHVCASLALLTVMTAIPGTNAIGFMLLAGMSAFIVLMLGAEVYVRLF